MRVTCFLLERRGYDVVQDGSGHIAEAARRCRADVVLLERDASRAATGRTLAALAALPAPPAVLALYSNADDAFPGVAGISKWAPLEELVGAIDEASLRRGRPLAQGASQS
jgi:hypothetical protein